MILFSLLIVFVVSSEATIQTWIWGEGGPAFLYDRNEEIELLSEIPHHGFIQLEYKPRVKAIVISLVKRPPGALFPRSEKFCSRMLPAAMAEFIRIHNIGKIKSISVIVEADPHIAACKCYMRTMISMGLTRVGDDRIVGEDDVEAFCVLKPPRHIGATSIINGRSGHSPITVSVSDLQLLYSTVTQIISHTTT